MKLPFDFSLKFIFRLVLPGALLAAGLWPLAKSILDRAGLFDFDEAAFGALVVFLGWLIVILDMQTYMLFEGRRYWPGWLRDCGVRCERRRLGKLEAVIEAFRENKASELAQREASVELRRFPINAETGAYEAQFPTRLGNLLAAFEAYPKRIYGMDAAFFWPRLWVVLDKDLKEDIDSQQAIVDAALYVCAVFVACAFLGLLYAGLRFWECGAFTYGGTPAAYLAAAGVSLVLAFFTYRGSLYSQAQFGETFKAVFDLHHDKVGLDDVLRDLVRLVDEPSLMTLDRNDKRMAIWRYLHNYRVKRPGDPRPIGVLELKRSKRL